MRFDGLKQAPSRAMLRAVGYKDADFKKPAIGVASTWSNLTPAWDVFQIPPVPPPY